MVGGRQKAGQIRGVAAPGVAARGMVAPGMAAPGVAAFAVAARGMIAPGVAARGDLILVMGAETAMIVVATSAVVIPAVVLIDSYSFSGGLRGSVPKRFAS